MKTLVSRELDLLFKKFIDDFPTLKLTWAMQWNEWTEKIVHYFSDLGKSEGFDSFCKNDPFEYMLDLCWIYGSDKPPINWMELALESEFSDRSIDGMMDDFSKLVDVKAYTKVFLCFPKIDEVDDLIKAASEMIRYNPFRFQEEKYLIILLTETRKRLFFTGVVMDSVGNSIQLGSKEFAKQK